LIKTVPSVNTAQVLHFLALIGLFLAPPTFARTPLTPVTLGFLESPYETENNPSSRYRERYEQAIAYAIGRAEKRLNSCGYSFRTVVRYFESSEKAKAEELAHALTTEKQTWFILGPRRSDHFLIAARGSGDTPIVSIMANASAIFDLKPPKFTMEEPISLLAASAVRAVAKEKYGTRYGVFVDATCPSCRDFARSFEEIGGTLLKKAFALDTAGESPDFKALDEALTRHPSIFCSCLTSPP
jgi:hypothetical protein